MHPRTILLAEDSLIQAASIADLLTERGFVVVTAEDGEDAWAKLEEHAVDLVLADGRMPRLDGYELCARVRADPRRCSLPFVLMTVYDEVENALRGLKCGADLFLAKPLDPELLVSRLERVLASARRPYEPGQHGTITTWFRDHSIEVHTDPGRAVDYLAGALEDVERSRHAEYLAHRKAEEARAARDFLQAALDTFPAEIAVIDGKGRILLGNRSWMDACESLDGVLPPVGLGEDLLASITQGLPGGPGDLFVVGIEEVLAGARTQYEIEFPVDVAGDRRWFVVLVNRFQGDGPVRAMVVRKEITARKTLDEQLRLAQKMKAVGTLTAAVAHEINNPLTYILGHLETLGRQIQEGPLQDSVQGVTEGVTRIREVVAQLKVFSHGETGLPPGPVDLASVVAGAARMAANELRFRARLELDLPPNLPPVQGLPGELGQVVLNLLVNAAHAIDEGDVEGNWIRVRLESTPGWVRLHVEDTGKGIPAEHLPRIFNPFFTTKPPGEGTGLGLSVCDGIVRSCGGHFEVESTVGEGSHFTVVLPTAPEPSRPGPRPEPIEEAPGEAGRARLLVVDDEPRLCDMVQRLLQDEHDVFLAGSGHRAQEILNLDRDFDMILCDMMMPDLSGMELLDWLRATWPELADRVVFMSGGAFTQRARRFQEESGGTILEKPFDTATLRAVVARKLRERARKA